MKTLTYIPRSASASNTLNLSIPGETITLIKETPVTVKDESVTWLQENDEEFKLCVKQKYIIVEESATKSEEAEETLSSPPPSVPGIKTTTTTTTVKK